MEKSSFNISADRKRQKTTSPTECKICGASAIYSYFGVISCSPCKLFFGRNAKHGRETLKCDFDGNCQIDINNRHVCSYCRLMKCFLSGMQTGMIRFPYPKRDKKKQKRKIMMDSKQTISKALVRLNEIEQLPTLNLLQSDYSTLTIDQWNLISNLSHCHDEHSGLSTVENYMHKQNTLPVKLRFKSESMIEMIHMSYSGSELLYNKNQDFLSLSSHDRSNLLRSTMKYTTTASLNFIYYKVGLMNFQGYYDAIELISHPSIMVIAKRLANHLDFDIIVKKLFLAILSFSTMDYTFYSNNPPINLSNIKQILHIQNTYIELIWRYLIYKYNDKQAIICFSNLLRCLFIMNEGIVEAQDVQWFTNKMDSLVEQIEQNLSYND
ncbi:unnamed protein product [Rotaria sordida]|uniref:Nuclear receptor domain-containing protein n=1 Tax=Rotaria sordida TaxID=392033 RepID=A0A815LSR8_9BILA|nr:unnamed protein product [Rotaria sordida]CAF3806356.1 unnamed protein product [Rotaria sordida]